MVGAAGNRTTRTHIKTNPKPSQRRVGGYERDSDDDADAEKRMQSMVRRQGKLSKKGGIMMSSGTAEYQVAGLDELERLVSRR